MGDGNWHSTRIEVSCRFIFKLTHFRLVVVEEEEHMVAPDFVSHPMSKKEF